MHALSHFSDETQLITVFSALFEHASQSVVLHHPDGEPIYYNPAILKRLNLEEHACPNLLSLRKTAPEYCKHLDQVLMTGKPSTMIFEAMWPPSHQKSDEELHFSPLFDSKHTLLGVICLGRDVSEIQQNDIASTQKQNEYLTTLINSLPFPVWMKNQEGNYLAINKQASADMGIACVQNLETTTDFNYFDAPQAEAFVNDDNHVMQTGQSKALVETIQKKDGSAYLSYTHKTPVFMDDKVVGTVGFSRNLTDEYKLQQTFTELENDYFAILNNLPLLIIVYDLECRRVFLNQHYLQSIGKKSDALIGTKPSENWVAGFINITGLEFEAQLKHAMKHNIILPLSCAFAGTTTRYFEKKLIPRLNALQEVCGVICIAQDVTDVYLARKALEHQAHFDVLTGLSNRTLFANYLNEAIAKAKQNNKSFVVMLLDLDRFKSINDSMGHALGDILLKEVANRIRTAHSDDYLCSRLGGDEFAILYTDYINQNAPAQLAEAILSAVSNVYQIDGAEYFISASIGITVYPEDTDNDENLLKYADTAMYAAKDAGRNTYKRYTIEQSQKAVSHFQLDHALRRALTDHELYVEYQPIVDLETHRIVGAEALCRWQNNKHGLVPPNEFIPIAEHTGLIYAISQFVIREAFHVASMVNQGQKHAITLSVNLSARLFKDSRFADHVIALLQETQCQPNWVKFEITETLLLDHHPDVIQALNTFNQMGIIISLDDFGTGQSSLGYLHKFPIQQIKIDRSFVREICENKSHAKLVKAIISLAKSLDKDLVAEGIETLEQAQLLKTFGCKSGQGYFYSKPCKLDAFLKMTTHGCHPSALSQTMQT